MSYSLTPEQIAQVQAQLQPNQALYADGTVRDTITGEIVATLAFSDDSSQPEAHAQSPGPSISIPDGAVQDQSGNVYFQGQMIYQMTAQGLIPIVPTETFSNEQTGFPSLAPSASISAPSIPPVATASQLQSPSHTAQSQSTTLPDSWVSNPLAGVSPASPQRGIHQRAATAMDSLSPNSPSIPSHTPESLKPQPSSRQSMMDPASSHHTASSAAIPTSSHGRGGHRSSLSSPASLSAVGADAIEQWQQVASSSNQEDDSKSGDSTVFMTADQMPLVPLGDLKGCTLLDDGQLLGADGSLFGWVQPDGVLIAPDGLALGRMPDTAALEMWEQGAKMLAKQEADRATAVSQAEIEARAQASADAAILRDSVPSWASFRIDSNHLSEQARSLLQIPPIAIVAESADPDIDDESKGDETKSNEIEAARQLQLSRSMTLRRSNSVIQTRAEPIPQIEIVEPEYDEEKDGIDDGRPLDLESFNQVHANRATLQYVNDFIPLRFASRPPRPFSDVPEVERFASNELFMEVFVWRRLSINPEQFTYVVLDGLINVLDKKAIKSLGPVLSYLTRTETLIIRQAGLKKLEGLNLPMLTMLDVSFNSITEVDSLADMVRLCRGVQQLNVSENPICEGSDWAYNLPTHKASIWKALQLLPNLEVLNGNVIPNKIRALALDRVYSNAQKERIPDIVFNFAINQAESVLAMKSWQPFALEKLNLSGQGLSRGHFGSFKMLTELNLSSNQFTTLQGLGLEQCQRLRRFAITSNKLTKENEMVGLHPLVFVSSLQELWISDNPGLGSHYADRLIHMLSNLKGDDRSPGLLSLDNEILSIEDRVRAFANIGKGTLQAQNELRWRLSLISNFGHHRVARSQEFFSHARCIELSNRNLSWVDVSAFISLQKLDLSNNQLTSIVGLERLICLRVIDVSNNPKLDQGAVLRQMVDFTGLEHVSVRTDPSKMKNIDLSYMKRVMMSLPNADRLSVIDGVVIQLQDRMTIVTQTTKMTHEQMCTYQINLALIVASSPVVGRDYNVKGVLERRGVVSDQLKELYGLSGLGLKQLDLLTAKCEFRTFLNLERLDLSNNDITEIGSLGLEHLNSLLWLDLRNNKIATEAQILAQQLDKLPVLEVLALKGNPIIRSKYEKADRLALIGHMKRLRQIDCSLRVLDSEITVNERVDAWKSAGLTSAEAEILRSQIALHVRTPPKVAATAVITLDLSNLELSRVQLSMYTNLKSLSLRGNKFNSLTGLGIECCPNLTVLDVRDNAFTSVDEVTRLVSVLPKLRVLALSGNKRLGSDYRGRVIAALPSLRDPKCELRFIDEEPISVVEIVAAHGNSVGSRDKADLLAFTLTVRRRLEEKNLQDSHALSLEELDISNGGLRAVAMGPMARLKRLNLDHNELSSTALQRGDFAQLRYLEVLSLRHNSFANIKTLAGVLDMLPALRVVRLTGNRAFSENSMMDRVALLQYMSRNAKTKFSLINIDDQPITIDERIAALEAAGTMEAAAIQRFRLELTLEKMGADPASTTALDLTQFRLTDISPLTSFTKLEALAIAGNPITHLNNQGLERLPNLRQLDLRHCQLLSFDDLLDALTPCHALTDIWIQGAVPADSSTKNPNDYAKVVCERLRGLRTVDGVKNPVPLSAFQSEAQEFLWQLARVGPNALHQVDISGRSLPSSLFFYFLAAMAELRLCTHLLADKNPWHTGASRISNYRMYIIYTLGEHLVQLDGSAVLADELRNALELIESETAENKCRIIKGGWRACREKAMADVRQWRAKRLAASTKRMSISGGGALPQVVSPDSVAIGVGAAAVGAADEKNDDEDDDEDEEAEKSESGPGFSDFGGGDSNLGQKLDAVWSTMASVTGSILTKFEIIINFFQVYGLILVIDLQIPWPNLWTRFSRFVHFFSFDIDIVFDFNIKYKEEIKFGCLVLVPLIILLLYHTINSMRSEEWIERYSNDWPSTKRRAFLIWFFLLLVSFAGSVFYDFPISYNLVLAAKFPSASVNGLIFACWAFVTLLYLIWYMVISNFRSNYVGVPHQEFLKWWLERTFLLRKLLLFGLTVLFMPAARIVLSQFQCNNLTGRLVEVPTQKCFPQEYSVIQIVAFVFGAIYILGIPIFFARLISEGTSVVAKAGFETRSAEVKAEIERLKGQREKFAATAWKVKEYDDAIEEYEAYLHTLWANEVMKNPLPQTYLYSSYEQRFRYYKLLQLFQKLVVLVITMYVPTETISSLKVIAGTAFQGAIALTSTIFRPFNDRFEDLMDIAAQSVNFVNILAAMGVSMQWMSDSIANIGLFVFNLAAMGFFFLNLMATPIRLCLAQRELVERAARLAAERAAESSSEMVSIASGAIGSGLQATGSSVVSAVAKVDIPAPVSAAASAASNQLSSVINSASSPIAGLGTKVIDTSQQVGGAASSAISQGAQAVAVAAPSLLIEAESLAKSGIEFAKEVAPEVKKELQSAAVAADSVSSSAALSVSSIADQASDFAQNESHLQVARAAAVTYVYENQTSTAEVAVENGVVAHSEKKDAELTEKFEGQKSPVMASPDALNTSQQSSNHDSA